MKVYHGGVQTIKFPLAKIGRPNLDFGRGFYVTDIRKQAENWAKRVGLRTLETPKLNIYELDMDLVQTKYRLLKFEDYNEAWLNFIVASRSGQTPWIEYDIVEGGVANDRVVDTVNLYLAGLIELSSALRELSRHQPNNQICILNQDIINKYLIYDGTEEI